jgi:DNA repair exonuclease SbcCD ATPase subunit
MSRLRLVIALCLLTLTVAGCAFHRAVERAEQFELAGDFESAVAAYEDALRLDPEDEDVRRRLTESRRHASGAAVAHGDEHLAAGRLRDARSSAIQALDHTPDHPDAVALRGRVRDAAAAKIAPPSATARGGQEFAVEGVDENEALAADEGLIGRWREAEFWCQAEGTKRLCAARDGARSQGLGRAQAAVDVARYEDARDLYALYAQIEPSRAGDAQRLRGEADGAEAADYRADAQREVREGRPEIAFILISRAAELSRSRDDERVRDMLRAEVAEAASLAVRLRVTGPGARTGHLEGEFERSVEGLSGAHLATQGEKADVRVHAPVCTESSVTAQRSLRYVHHIEVVPNPQVALLERELHIADDDIGHWQAKADRAEQRATRAQRDFHIARERDDRRRDEAIRGFQGELAQTRRARREAAGREKKAAEDLAQAQRAVDEVRRLEARREELRREQQQADRARDEVRQAQSRVRDLESRLERLRRDNTPDSRSVQRAAELRERVAAARAAAANVERLEKRVERLEEQIRKLRALAARDQARREDARAKIEALQARKKDLKDELQRERAAARDLARLERELARVEELASVGRNSDAIARVERELEGARRDLEQARGRAGNADRLAQRVRELESRLRTARSGCPNVGPLASAHERARRELAQADAAVERCRELLDAAENRWVRSPEVVDRRRHAREAEVEFVRIKARCDAAYDHHERLEHDLARTARTVEEPVYAVHSYLERGWTRICRSEATVEHAGRTTVLRAESRTEDRSHPGFEPAGLRADPKAYPKADASLISAADNRVVTEFKGLVAASVDARRAGFERSAAAAKTPEVAARNYVRALMVDPSRPAPTGLRQVLREVYGADVSALTRKPSPVSNR